MKKWEEELKKEFYGYLDTDTYEELVGFIFSLLHSQKKEMVKILKANKFKRIGNDLTWYLNYDDIIKKLEEK